MLLLTRKENAQGRLLQASPFLDTSVCPVTSGSLWRSRLQFSSLRTFHFLHPKNIIKVPFFSHRLCEFTTPGEMKRGITVSIQHLEFYIY